MVPCRKIHSKSSGSSSDPCLFCLHSLFIPNHPSLPPLLFAIHLTNTNANATTTGDVELRFDAGFDVEFPADEAETAGSLSRDRQRHSDGKRRLEENR